MDIGKEVREVVRGGAKRNRKTPNPKTPNPTSAKPKDVPAEPKVVGKEVKKDVPDSPKDDKKTKRQWRSKHQGKPRPKAKAPSSQVEKKDAKPVKDDAPSL